MQAKYARNVLMNEIKSQQKILFLAILRLRLLLTCLVILDLAMT